ncbi:MAG TPA: chalcone isomerase family protein [Gammaproteobacteria bacterium]|nr:chalcone isomerase family protein [Gammaproteobacteria bacterium]
MRNSLTYFLSILMSATAFGISAATLEGVSLPDSAMVGNKVLVLNGLGLREKFFVDVYVGGLYLQTKATTSDAVMAEQGPYRVVMHMLHDVSHGQFSDAWLDDLENNNPSVFRQLQPQTQQFTALFDDARDGDEIVMDFVPGTGLSVTHNGKLMGAVAGDDFARAVLHCYVGPNPPTEKLKKGMLGGNT